MRLKYVKTPPATSQSSVRGKVRCESVDAAEQYPGKFILAGSGPGQLYSMLQTISYPINIQGVINPQYSYNKIHHAPLRGRVPK